MCQKRVACSRGFELEIQVSSSTNLVAVSSANGNDSALAELLLVLLRDQHSTYGLLLRITATKNQ